MKAIICEKFAPVEELQYQEVDDPKAGPGQVVIDIAALGVNYPDGLLVQGLYQMKPSFPFTPGSEVSGRVSELGAGIKHLKVGQRVIALGMLNGYAEKLPVTPLFSCPPPTASRTMKPPV